MNDPTPRVDIPHESALCPLHGEPFRALWPSGYPLFVVEGFKALLDLPAFADACGGDVGKATDLLAHEPLCCRLHEEDHLLELYHHVHHMLRNDSPWCMNICRGCKRPAVGGPFRTVQQQWSHLCLACVCYRMRGA